MFDLGWTEMLLIGIVALIVVGPKDLPGLFRSAGQFMGKAKGMAREFSTAMNAAADESGLKEINKTIKAAANPQKFGADKLRDAATGSGSGGPKPDLKEGGETEAVKSKLSDERAANAEKINKAMARAAQDRIASEKAQTAAEAVPKGDAAAKKAAPKKTASKPAAANKTAPKRPATKKAAPKKAAPKKAAAKKAAPKTTAKDAK